MVEVHALDQPNIKPLQLPDRFKTEVVYFMTPADKLGRPPFPPGEYWIDLKEAKTWLDDYVIEVVSPLAADVKAEMELTDYQEQWLEWLLENKVQHIRVA